MSPKEVAERASRILHEGDRVAQAMGMKIDEVDAGRAVLSLAVREEHANGHGICHGGIIFTLADTAFAHACNSHNQRAVAQHNSISYIAPARTGDRLVATAREVSLEGRNGIYDVSVIREDGTKIAVFRGASRSISGTLFDE